MNQTAEAIKTNKVVIRIKVASDSIENVAKVESSNKSSGLLWLIASVICLALAIWYWSSQQSEQSNDAIESAVSMNTDTPVNTPPAMNETSSPPPVVIPDLPQNPPPADPVAVVEETQHIPVLVSEVVEEKLQAQIPASATNVESPKTDVLQLKKQEEVVPTAKSDDSINNSSSIINQTSSKLVARATFAFEIKNREPINKIDNQVEAKKAGLKRIYFFSEMRGLKGKTVIHRWLYKGKKQGEVVFEVGGNQWRINSNKHIRPDQTGLWQVDIVTADNNQVLLSRSFNYGPVEALAE